MPYKTIAITGASSGIGKEMALQYAGNGILLILGARRIHELQEIQKEILSKGGECLICPLDITNQTSIREFADFVTSNCEKLDILVNNAGISQRGKAAETDDSTLRRIMEVNFFGTANLTVLLLPLVKAAKGIIIVMSSFSGLFGFPLRSAYSASKFALHGYFETLRLEEPEISVTIACPGRIQTDISLSALKADGTAHGEMDPGQLKGIPVHICARKIIRAADNKKRIVYIAKEEKILLFLRKFAPKLFDKIARKVSAK